MRRLEDRPLVKREIDRFREEPASMRRAALVLTSFTVAAVLIGSLVMWIFDRRDFPDFETAFWFTLQTVTTVGYGDVTPSSTFGRFVAGIVMVVAIGFLAIVTALITSTFIDAAQRQRRFADSAAQRDASDHVDTRFAEVLDRLTAIEASLARLEAVGSGASAPSAFERPADPVPPTPRDETGPGA